MDGHWVDLWPLLWNRTDSVTPLAAQPHQQEDVFGDISYVDTNMWLHPSLPFPLVLIFPRVLFCSEIFQDFSHCLGNLEMESLSKNVFTRFHVMQEEKQKSLKLNLGWSGLGWSSAHARKTPNCSTAKKVKLPQCLVWEISAGILEKMTKC